MNVREERALNALIRTESADVFLIPVGQIVADVGVDRDLLAVPAVEARVNAQVDVSQRFLSREDRQCLDFAAIDVDARVDIKRAVGMTYRILRHICRGLNGGSIVSGLGVNGRSVDCDGEDSADDGEKLYGEHHCVS